VVLESAAAEPTEVPAAAMVLVVVFLLVEVLAAFYYSALAGRVPEASHEDFLPRVFAPLSLLGRHPEQCYHTAIKSVPGLVVALALASAVLPVLPLASEGAEEA
jgi:hypothetical protein